MMPKRHNDKTHYIGKGERLAFNKKASIPYFFEHQVQRTPYAIAVRSGKSTITYSDLDQRINQTAHYLVSLGVVAKVPVALYVHPTIDLVVALFAILKIGAYYIPLDTNYPAERIAFMLKDSDAQWVITQSSLQPNIPEHLITIDLARLNDNIQPYSAAFTSHAHGYDLAYMMYTSGSTGVPKGVKIAHQAVNNHMVWMSHQFQFDSSDSVLLKTPLSFDPSVWELFIPLYTGGELIIAPSGAHIDPELMIDLISHYGITTVQLVPSILKLLLNSKQLTNCQTLKKVFVGGESLRPEIKALFFQRLDCQLINLYGPTEATIDITFHIVCPADIHINTIGKPIANTAIYLANDAGHLAAVGEEGEIFIGSLSLAEGYHRRDALTKEHFIDNPFEPTVFKRIYKTGDLARWLPNGELEYLGRNNDQVKINGVRIEPKELTLTILQQPDISDCIVVKKIDSHGHDYLACYLIARPQITPDIAVIRQQLKEKFPAFMLPKTYLFIDNFPLNPNGKVDVHALPHPNFKQVMAIDSSEGALVDVEEKLLYLWQMVLEINQVTIDDNFFDAGGHSLLALKLLTLIHEHFHITMKIRDLFDYQTVKQQARYIKQLQNHVEHHQQNHDLPCPVLCLQPGGVKTPLFLIHPIGGTVFWFSKLAHLLGTSRPIYGIQDPSIDLERPVLASIEEMAAFYLSHIKKIQPTGPYLIGGASFGATVAAEISKRLSHTNESLAALICLDGWGIYPNTLLDDNYFKQTMHRQHQELQLDFERYGLPSPDVLFNIQWYRLQLLWHYQLTLIEHPLVLFKSQEMMPAFMAIDAPYNHWENFTNQAIHLIPTPGTHETMFQEPHVYQLGRLINNYLEDHKL